MRSYKRALALLLSLLLTLPLLSACTSKQEKLEQTVIGTCAGYDVLYEELRYVTLTYKDLFEDTYGEGIWDSPESAAQYRAELEETVWRVMLNNYAVLAACQYYMPHVTADNETINKSIDQQIEDTIESYGGKKAFRQELESMHMTENFLRFCLLVAAMENELLYVLTDDLGLIYRDAAEFLDWIEQGNAVYVQHVFIRNDKGDSVEANRALAEQIRADLSTGTPIDVYVGSSANEDLSNTAPYYLVRDVYTKVMEDAAFALEQEGDVSDVIEVEDGFYVLVRMPWDDARLLAQSSHLLNSYQWAKVEQIADDYKDRISIELNEFGKSIDLLSIS